MIFATPPISRALQSQLGELSDLRTTLGDRVVTASRWMGSLRRSVRASSFESSTSIEGFTVSPEEALALANSRDVADRGGENRQAVTCYAHAMDHVGTLAIDPSFEWADRVILDLHFDTCYFQRDKDPGLWRTGPIGVTAPDGSLDYQGPDGDQVVTLMNEVVEWLATRDLDADVVVRAAMAHLNVVSVHPFRDGNGRVSRILQSLVLAREGLAAPEFFSIEEYLGSHTAEYYAALRQAHGPTYQPDRDASKWVAFCVNAHIVQARQRLAQIEAAATRWAALEELAEGRGWPDRLVIALEQSLVGGTDRGKYADEAGISIATASADFRRLADAGLVDQRGGGRSISYLASKRLHGTIKDASGD